ncbi:low molecular mass early light-inducible protein HV90, chloroplastic [Brachypodium distachyon]|uniref:Uncharacterized protein n=1 Tax=Brachypodium distachyon TaxID=15368 RepID=I1H350_BRADI|nr:low molecular mass early light-inducible protein HV90, chloroplastic [Brachypodium distachyon]KQK20607.1 hypothetical protein BRADI_1g55580v3 [Brachypodium distachyon]|eukprot:XP_003557497.1 low molecular mass early light-inducible protein HV90, chloroplastic [Brachypodium distachyon]
MATMMSTTATFAGAAVLPRAAAAAARSRTLSLRPRTRTSFVVRAQNDKEPTPNKPAAASVWDILSFSGPAPERINGRLAMVGFVAALSVEAARGGGLLSQAGSGAGMGWFLTTTALLSVASLVPLLQGQSVESKSSAFWSSDAELWNGRAAMLGLVALAATEVLTGAPFVNL